MSDRDYLDRYSKRTADTRIVTLIARNTDGTYTYETVDNKARGYATPANPSDFFTLNSRVEIQDPSASRTVLGAMPVIVSRAPRDQRGLSATTPDEQLTFRDGASIIAVDPDPLELVAGGDPGVQVIIGSGFTAAGIYEARGAAPDPTIADDSAPVVTATKITRTISAGVASPLGEFDFLVGGVRARKALRVIDAPEMDPVPLLIIAGYVSMDGVNYTPHMWIVDPGSLAVLADLEQETFSAIVLPGPLARDGNRAYMIFGDNATQTSLMSADLVTRTDLGAVDLGEVGDPLLVNESETRAVVYAGSLVFGATRSSNGDGGVWTLPLTEPLQGDGVTLVSLLDTGIQAGLYADGGNLIVPRVTFDLLRLSMSDWSQNGTNADVNGLHAVRELSWTAEDGYGEASAFLWVGATAGHIFRLNAASLSTANDIAIGGSFNPVRSLAQLRGAIFALTITTGFHLFRVTTAGAVDLGAVNADPAWPMVSDGESLFLVGTDGVIRKIDYDGNVTASSDSLYPVGFDDCGVMDMLVSWNG